MAQRGQRHARRKAEAGAKTQAYRHMCQVPENQTVCQLKLPRVRALITIAHTGGVVNRRAGGVVRLLVQHRRRRRVGVYRRGVPRRSVVCARGVLVDELSGKRKKAR